LPLLLFLTLATPGATEEGEEIYGEKREEGGKEEGHKSNELVRYIPHFVWSSSATLGRGRRGGKGGKRPRKKKNKEGKKKERRGKVERDTGNTSIR